MRLLRRCRLAASREREDPEHGPHREGEKTAQLLKRSEVTKLLLRERSWPRLLASVEGD